MPFEVHRIRPGDQLYKIMSDTYGRAKFIEQKEKLLAAVLEANPQITDIDKIYAGRTLALPILPTMSSAYTLRETSNNQKALNKIVCEEVSSASGQAQDTLHQLSAFDEAARAAKGALLQLHDNSLLLNSAAGAYTGLGELANKASTTYLQKTKDLQFTQALMKEGKIANPSYYQNRTASLAATDTRFSIIRNTLGKRIEPTSKILRISQDEARMAKSLKKSIGFAESLSKRAKYAGRGFFVLSGAIGAARYFNEDNAKERSGIILETAGSLSAGAGAGAAGMAISAALLSNPAGWAVIVGVTLVSLAAGYAGGEIGKAAGEALHDAIGDKDDDIFEALIP